MKYMLNCRQTIANLKYADEIKVDYKDKERIKDLIEFTDKDFIIYVPKDIQVDWQEFEKYRSLINLVFAFENPKVFSQAKAHNWQYFWAFPITSYYELNGVLDQGVAQVLLGAPLYFDLPQVKSICQEVEIRLVANLCHDNLIPRDSGATGTYIRPEDVQKYEEYVQHLEFAVDSLSEELTYLKIYKKDKVWAGNLNLLLKNFDINVDNRALQDEDFAARRISCRQKCQINKCHYCKILFKLIQNIDKKEF